MNVKQRRRRPDWQRTLLVTFTWILLAAFVLTSVGVALVTFSVR
jgi:hypothetical protein